MRAHKRNDDLLARVAELERIVNWHHSAMMCAASAFTTATDQEPAFGGLSPAEEKRRADLAHLEVLDRRDVILGRFPRFMRSAVVAVMRWDMEEDDLVVVDVQARGVMAMAGAVLGSLNPNKAPK